MSKAFTKESDTGNDLDNERLDEYVPPPGGRNFLTPAGFKKLSDELHQLEHVERPQLVTISGSVATDASTKNERETKLRAVERRIRYLTQCLQIAEVVATAGKNLDEVQFGARVTVTDDEGDCKTYWIVGIEEADSSKGRISWVSPLASSLRSGSIGDFVTVTTPRGERNFEIIAIAYDT